MKMRRVLVENVIVGWMILGPWCAPAAADGGSLRFTAKEGGYQVTVFSAPTPFRAGPVDISVLVQDRLTGAPMPDARVTLCIAKLGQPALEYPATREAATNKLFRAAQFVLPERGRWKMQVEVAGLHGTVVIEGDLDAAGPLPRWRETWPWIGWPALAIALFGIHQVLARRGTAGDNSTRLTKTEDQQ
jgi:hypothetical protein